MNSVIKTRFRKCKVSDFDAHGDDGGHISPEFKQQIEKRICPDTDGLGDHFMLKNDYTNLTERNSFYLEILMCSNPSE